VGSGENGKVRVYSWGRFQGNWQGVAYIIFFSFFGRLAQTATTTTTTTMAWQQELQPLIHKHTHPEAQRAAFANLSKFAWVCVCSITSFLLGCESSTKRAGGKERDSWQMQDA